MIMVKYLYLQQIKMQSTQSQYLSIKTNKPPIRSKNVYHMLIFQWILFLYNSYLFISVTHSNNQYQTRLIIYCILFILFDKLQLTSKYLQLEDPLHLSATTNCIRFLTYICLINMLALLVRIVIYNQNMHAFMIIMHFLLIIALFLNEFSKKNIKLDINVDSNNVFSKYVTPLSLFIFNKTSQSNFSQSLYMQLIFLAVNQFLSSELNRILLLKQCQYLGWVHFEQSCKQKSAWNRRRALRSIIVICCVIIVVQNLLLIFQRIKFEVSVLIIHSLIISCLTYMLYIGYALQKK